MSPTHVADAKLEMCRLALIVALACPAFLAAETSAPVPTLPDGSHTRWVVSAPEEIVTYLAFDPATVRRRLPASLRFITIGELASGGVEWAREFLVEHPTKGQWGVSFLEFLRAGTFTIAGRPLAWPVHGATALWFARVAPSAPATDLGFGRPFLALDFWIPDRAYVDYMLGKGYYASYGDVTLQKSSGGKWSASLAVEGLDVTVGCAPAGPVTGGPGAAGSQAIFPPASASITEVVRVAFAGHREQSCQGEPSLRLRGKHPLGGSIVLGPSVFQFGYELRGGAYPHP